MARVEQGAAGSGRKITRKQADYALDLASENDLDESDLSRLCRELFGAELHNLTSAQASELIAYLLGE